MSFFRCASNVVPDGSFTLYRGLKIGFGDAGDVTAVRALFFH
jgi:hypothetical protein